MTNFDKGSINLSGTPDSKVTPPNSKDIKIYYDGKELKKVGYNGIAEPLIPEQELKIAQATVNTNEDAVEYVLRIPSPNARLIELNKQIEEINKVLPSFANDVEIKALISKINSEIEALQVQDAEFVKTTNELIGKTESDYLLVKEQLNGLTKALSKNIAETNANIGFLIESMALKASKKDLMLEIEVVKALIPTIPPQVEVVAGTIEFGLVPSIDVVKSENLYKINVVIPKQDISKPIQGGGISKSVVSRMIQDASLQTQIDVLSGNADIFRVEVAAISSGLNSRIIIEQGINVNQAVQISELSGNSISQSTQIAELSGRPIPDIFRVEVADISSGLNSRLTIEEGINVNQATQISELSGNSISQSTQIAELSGRPIPDIFRIEVAAVSSGLQTQIDAIVQEGTVIIGGPGITASHVGLVWTVGLSGTFADGNLRSEVMAVSAYLNDNDSNQAIQISELSGNSISQASQIAELSGRTFPDHNDLNGLDGVGGDGGYWHLTEDDYKQYIWKSEVAAVSAGLDTRIDTLQLSASYGRQVLTDMLEPTGFLNRTDSTISFNDTTRTFTIAGTYVVYCDGTKFTKTGESQVINDTHGLHFLYYNKDGVFTYSDGVAWDLLAPDCVISVIYWDAINQIGIIIEERHGIVMDAATHYYNHAIYGTQRITPGAITGVVPQTDTDSSIQFAVGNTVLADEDIFYTTVSGIVSGHYHIAYRTGAAGLWDIAQISNVPYLVNNNSARTNELSAGQWVLRNLTTNDTYFNYYVVASTSISGEYSYLLIPGQTIYSSLALAQGESFANLSLGVFPFQEFNALYQINYRFRNTYGTTGKSRIEVTPVLLGLRSVTASSTVPAHNGLIGLQGGTTNEYFHLTNAQANDLIGRAEVESISSGLNNRLSIQEGINVNQATQISELSGNSISQSTQIAELSGRPIADIFRVEVASISSGLDSRITIEEGININQAVQISELSGNSISQASQIASLSGRPIADIFRVEVASISSGLQTQIDAITGGGTGDITKAEVAAISAGLQSQIDAITGGGTGDITKAEVAAISAGLYNRDESIWTVVNAITGKNILNLTAAAGGLQNIVLYDENDKLTSDPSLTSLLLTPLRNFKSYKIWDFRDQPVSDNWAFTNATGTDTPGLTGGFIYSPTTTDSYMTTTGLNFNPHKYNAISITYKTPGTWVDRVSCQIYMYDGSIKLTNAEYLRPTYGEWSTEVVRSVLDGCEIGNTVTQLRVDLMNIEGYVPMNVGQIAVGQFGEYASDITKTEVAAVSAGLQTQIAGISGMYTSRSVDSGQSFTGSAWTTVVFNVENSRSGGTYAASGAYYVPQDGTYNVCASITLDSGGDTTAISHAMGIYKNNVEMLSTYNPVLGWHGAGVVSYSIAGSVKANVGDYITVKYYPSRTISLFNFSNYNNFSIFRI